MQIGEVDDIAEPHPVEDVARGTPQHEAQRLAVIGDVGQAVGHRLADRADINHNR